MSLAFIEIHIHCKLVDPRPMVPGCEQTEFSDNVASLEMHLHWSKVSVFIRHI